jgi:tyrosyl-tRNA synthetase
MLTGRQLVKDYLNKEKFVLTVPLLTDSKGTKIGKTEGNVIGLTDDPTDFYGKIMALGDDAIVPCFTLLTDESDSKISEIADNIKNGENPMQYKKLLAYKLTLQFNSEKKASLAQEEFEKVHQNRIQADVSTSLRVKQGEYALIDLITTEIPDLSRSQAKRLLQDGAVEINSKKQNDTSVMLTLKKGDIIKIGKTKFIRVES